MRNKKIEVKPCFHGESVQEGMRNHNFNPNAPPDPYMHESKELEEYNLIAE
jgi:hypothetical protein